MWDLHREFIEGRARAAGYVAGGVPGLCGGEQGQTGVVAGRRLSSLHTGIKGRPAAGHDDQAEGRVPGPA